LFIYLLS